MILFQVFHIRFDYELKQFSYIFILIGKLHNLTTYSKAHSIISMTIIDLSHLYRSGCTLELHLFILLVTS